MRAGRATDRAGVTLIEMLLVVTLIGLMVGISFPAISSGVDSLRLTTAADSTATFLNSALNRAERRQQVMEVTISKQQGKLTLRSTEAGFTREFTMPTGVSITAVLPDHHDSTSDRHVFLYPGGTVPRVGVELSNKRGTRRIVRVDPMTGVPEIEIPTEEPKK
ncbi:MAG: prepilin-type N-terminal cleavage/methylation domain-containing protein [Bryobacteraceae bacterium]